MPRRLPSMVANNGAVSRTPTGRISTAADIVRSFNTWAFKREQPSDRALLEQTVAAALGAGRPIPFVLYWGKGPRHAIAEPDLACMDFLAAMLARVLEHGHVQPSLTLILTDTHATLNNHGTSEIERYFGDIAEAAAERGFATCRLGSLVAAYEALALPPRAEVMTTEMLEALTRSAAKWYGGPDDVVTGARRYLAMNLVEKRAVEHAFPAAIFVTFNSSEFRPLFPDTLPVFYMYSVRKGVAVKPWFMEQDAKPAQPLRAVVLN